MNSNQVEDIMYAYHKTLTKLALAILVALGPFALPVKADTAWCGNTATDCMPKQRKPELDDFVLRTETLGAIKAACAHALGTPVLERKL
jgi:hypothetical protein